jgi:hypothetical protein
MSRLETRILALLVIAAPRGVTGSKIVFALGLWFYPSVALIRLEKSGQIVSGWREGNFPRQRIYKLADDAKLREAMDLADRMEAWPARKWPD